jgi:hypothetical protein
VHESTEDYGAKRSEPEWTSAAGVHESTEDYGAKRSDSSALKVLGSAVRGVDKKTRPDNLHHPGAVDLRGRGGGSRKPSRYGH